MRSGAILVIGLIAVAGLILIAERVGRPSPVVDPPAASPAVAAPEMAAPAQESVVPPAAPGTLTRATFPGAWPFDVPSVSVACVAGPTRVTQVLTVTIDGKAFALNGTAKGQGFPALDAHWLDNPDIPGAKVSISDMITAAQQLCPAVPAPSSAGTGIVEAAVRNRLKDPDSAVFRDVLFDKLYGVACGKVNAKNGFGGYTGFSQFWVKLQDGREPIVLIDSGDVHIAAAACAKGPR